MGTDAVTMSYNAVTALGLLQSAGMNIAAGTKAQAKDGGGKTASVTYTDWTATGTAEYVPYDGVTFPPHNGIVQVAGFQDTNMNGAYRVTTVGETYSYNGYPAKSIGLERYLDNSLPAATTTTTTTTT
jgi:hypothetical protein